MSSVKLHLFLLCVAGVALLGHQCCDAKVMMEYIGATGQPVTFNPYPSAKPQNGKFSPYWVDTLTPQSVAAIKERHPNVKALASLSAHYLAEKPKCHSCGHHRTFSTTVLSYMELFNKYGDVIRYVNHQFYTDKVRSPKGYLAAFQLRATQFDRDKLLPSYEVNGRGIQGEAFFDALNLLEANGFDVSGVMIFSADASSSNNYYYERKSQAFLTNSTSV
ncbi:hypothetical protein POTOM_020693 [Populus tomentosa]|uniref:Uncharacterized protein n=1 Tax=Populus tomentosa TaxID=118781 RepID=A0A8X7ZQM3_POPTO|nr:hypothetical protein POTOM_020693 [Populus tomentosa]